ncbi:MAG: DEAD/DEAH box helicase [OCS116 cluster bacterium]|nr:DEAD/DEAH box helicase [OCS116 cluster bacterium]
MNYSDLDLPEALQHTLAAMEFTKMTPIQEQAIPVALEGKDILGSAQTGTGKTAAFLVPLVNHILDNPNSVAIVVLPTRELAKQVHEVANKLLGRKTKNRSVCLIGGESMDKQLKTLRQNPRIIIGTPGRMNDHLGRRSLSLHHCDFVVLDETDRMLDMGFGVQIDEIFTHMSGARQVLMFSATIPKNIAKLANKYLEQPQRIAIEPTPEQALKIEHTALRLTEKGKFDALVEEIKNREGSIIVFGKTRMMTQKAADRLRKLGIDAEAIHGDLRQHKRERIIRNFHAQKFRILVATDVAARGLDIPHIEHVIINDLPQVPEDYIHRIGRTGRNGKSGKAIVFLTPRDNKQWRLIQRILPEGLTANETYGSYEAEMAAEYDSKHSFRQDNDRSRGNKGGGKKESFRTNKKRKDNKRKKFFGEGGEGFDPLKADGAARRISERSTRRSEERTGNDESPRRDRDRDRKRSRNQDDRNSYSRDERPARRERNGDDRNSYSRDERPARRERNGDDRKSYSRDERPARRERNRDDRNSYSRDERPARRDRDDRSYGDDRSSKRPEGSKTGNPHKKRGDTWAGAEENGGDTSRRDSKKFEGKRSEGWAKPKKKNKGNGGSTRNGEGHAYKPKAKKGPNKRAMKRQMAS